MNEIHITKPLPSLKANIPDYLAPAIRSVLGIVPIAGPLLCELCSLIPNQKSDRVAKWVVILGERIARLEEAVVRAQLSDENFTDVLEETVIQATRSLSDERRAYLAELVVKGIASEEIEYFETRHLLRILGEINDVEVIILRYYLVTSIPDDEKFRVKYEDILFPRPPTIGGQRSAVEKYALHTSYKDHLSSLGLLERTYKEEALKYDGAKLGAPKPLDYRITSMGRLLLKHIGLADEDYQPVA